MRCIHNPNFRIAFAISLTFGLSSTSSAQSIPPTWLSVYDGDGHGVDISSSMIMDRFGNAYITGRSGGISSGQDIVTLKYSRQGNRLLTLRYNGAANSWDEGNALATDDSGNIYVAGTSFLNSSRSEAIIIKYSSSGTTQWEGHYAPLDTNTSATILKLVIDSSTNTLVAGGNSLLLRYTLSGSLLSAFSYLPDSLVQPYPDTMYQMSDLKTASDGSICVVGTKSWMPEGGDVPEADGFSLKLDSHESLLWMRFFDAYGAKSLAVDGDDNLLVTTNDPVSIVKYDGNGELLWSKSYPLTTDAFVIITDLKTDSMNNVYVTGYGFAEQTAFDYVTVKLDPNGNELWSNHYDSGDTTRDFGSALALDKEGAVYVTGSSMYGWYDSSRSSTVKYDARGRMVGEAYFSRGRYTGGRGIAVSDSGDVFVGGDLS
ncbi:MAG TPA: SBBP repeat-containing protein, partial [Bacteroidota bacterium]|nr:SBBP repeat-containing protein [Bacteroidota bacterium]